MSHRRPLASLLLGLATASLGSTWATAQQRTQFVFHVYVDPNFGDNQLAYELNPGNPPDASISHPGSIDQSLHSYLRWPLQTRPRPVASDTEMTAANPEFPLTGNLQHAPYSFRTLSGGFGAISYVNALFDDNAGAAGPSLPWTNPDNQAQVTHVVIHCLPGLYGPRTTQPDIDPETGQQWNGEALPIRLGPTGDPIRPHGLYDGVSIQGTSALDTIFDARGDDQSLDPYTRSASVFEIWSTPWNYTVPSDSHANAFIDGIRIRNANVATDQPDRYGAAIHMLGNGSPIRMTVTNCIFVNNMVGIALDSHGLCDTTGGACQCGGDPACPDRWGQHEPVLVNNTFYGNDVGIWAGQITRDNPPSVGFYSNLHAPLVANNIFISKLSNFEGLSQGCFLLGQIDDLPIPAPQQQDFNAFDPSMANLGYIPPVPSYSNALPGGTFTTPQPRVDTRLASNYFVRDLLEGAGVASNDHDLRLSPYVSTAPKTSPGSLTPLVNNPLIAAGVNLATDRGNPGPALANAFGTGFDIAPGLPPGVEEAPLTGWDFDCEGFGNPRLIPRSGVIIQGPFGSIDIGADQCGRLIMANYLPSTRIFLNNHPQSGLSSFNSIYYVHTPGQTGPRALHNYVIGNGDWFQNIQSLPEPDVNRPPMGSNPPMWYTAGSANIERGLLYATNFTGPIARGLECDFSPLLLGDHRLWGTFFNATWSANGELDPYGANFYHSSWWSLAGQPGFAQHFLDNPCVFHNRYHSSPHGSTTWPQYAGERTWVMSGHMNPPGSILNPAQDVAYIASPTGFFGPWSACGTSTLSFGNWCLNACPDQVPALGLELGLRINCEIPRSLNPFQAHTNLQTFIAIPNSPTAAASSAQPSMPSLSLAQVLNARAAGVSLSELLNAPAILGPELDHRAYAESIRMLSREND